MLAKSFTYLADKKRKKSKQKNQQIHIDNRKLKNNSTTTTTTNNNTNTTNFIRIINYSSDSDSNDSNNVDNDDNIDDDDDISDGFYNQDDDDDDDELIRYTNNIDDNCVYCHHLTANSESPFVIRRNQSPLIQHRKTSSPPSTIKYRIQKLNQYRNKSPSIESSPYTDTKFPHPRRKLSDSPSIANVLRFNTGHSKYNKTVLPLMHMNEINLMKLSRSLSKRMPPRRSGSAKNLMELRDDSNLIWASNNSPNSTKHQQNLEELTYILFKSVENNDLKSVEAILNNPRVTLSVINTCNHFNLTPLDMAMLYNHSTVAKRLMESGGRNNEYFECNGQHNGKFLSRHLTLFANNFASQIMELCSASQSHVDDNVIETAKRYLEQLKTLKSNLDDMKPGSPPRKVTLEVAGLNSLLVSVSPPSDSVVTRYRIEWSRHEDFQEIDDEIIVRAKFPVGLYQILDLQPHTAYYVRVYSLNLKGAGSYMLSTPRYESGSCWTEADTGIDDGGVVSFSVNKRRPEYQVEWFIPRPDLEVTRLSQHIQFWLASIRSSLSCSTIPIISASTIPITASSSSQSSPSNPTPNCSILSTSNTSSGISSSTSNNSLVNCTLIPTTDNESGKLKIPTLTNVSNKKSIFKSLSTTTNNTNTNTTMNNSTTTPTTTTTTNITTPTNLNFVNPSSLLPPNSPPINNNIINNTMKFIKSSSTKHPGLYLGLVYHAQNTDKILLGPDEQLPLLQVEENVPSLQSANSDALWLSRLLSSTTNATSIDLRLLIELIQRLSLPPSIHTRVRLLSVCLQLQTTLLPSLCGRGELGLPNIWTGPIVLVHHSNSTESQSSSASQNSILILLVHSFPEQISTSTSLKWSSSGPSKLAPSIYALNNNNTSESTYDMTPYKQFLFETFIQSYRRIRPNPPVQPTNPQQTLVRPPIIPADGLYLAYLQCRTTLDQLYVLLHSSSTPVYLPMVKVRDNCHVDAVEWTWIRSLKKRSEESGDLDIIRVQMDHQSQQKGRKFQRQLVDAWDRLCDLIQLNLYDEIEDDSDEVNEGGGGEEEGRKKKMKKVPYQYRVYVEEVLLIRPKLSMIVVIPRVEDCVLPPGRDKSRCINNNLMSWIPLHAMELCGGLIATVGNVGGNANMACLTNGINNQSNGGSISGPNVTNNLGGWLGLLAVLDLLLPLANHAARQAFEQTEIEQARERIAELQSIHGQADKIWREFRWLDDIIRNSRDRQLSSIVTITIETLVTTDSISQKSSLCTEIHCPDSTNQNNSCQDCLNDTTNQTKQKYQLLLKKPTPPIPLSSPPPLSTQTNHHFHHSKFNHNTLITDNSAKSNSTSNLLSVNFSSLYISPHHHGGTDSTTSNETRSSPSCISSTSRSESPYSIKNSRIKSISTDTTTTRATTNTTNTTVSGGSTNSIDSGSDKPRPSTPQKGVIRVYAGYPTGLLDGTSVKVLLTVHTTARDVVRLIVKQLNDTARNRNPNSPYYSDNSLPQFNLVVSIDKMTRPLPDEFHPLLLKQPWKSGKLIVKIKDPPS